MRREGSKSRVKGLPVSGGPYEEVSGVGLTTNERFKSSTKVQNLVEGLKTVILLMFSDLESRFSLKRVLSLND